MYFIVNFWGKKHSNKSCVEDDEKIRGMVKFDGFKEKNLHMFSYSYSTLCGYHPSKI